MGDLFLLSYIFATPYLLACMMRKVVAGKFPSTECLILALGGIGLYIVIVCALMA